MNGRRSVGIEIEFFGVHHELVTKSLAMVGIKCDNKVHGKDMKVTSKNWKLVADRSVTPDETGADRVAFTSEIDRGLYKEGDIVRRGLELVSPILWNSQDFLQLKKVLRVLKTIGAKVDETCGVHVHLGVDDLSVTEVKELLISYARSEEFFDSISPIYRRGNSNQYCRSVCWNHIEDKEGGIEWLLETLGETPEESTGERFRANFCELRGDAKGNDPKYKKLNVRNFFENHTVEFRHMYGCLDYDVVQTWVDMFLRLVEFK